MRTHVCVCVCICNKRMTLFYYTRCDNDYCLLVHVHYITVFVVAYCYCCYTALIVAAIRICQLFQGTCVFPVTVCVFKPKHKRHHGGEFKSSSLLKWYLMSLLDSLKPQQHAEIYVHTYTLTCKRSH